MLKKLKGIGLLLLANLLISITLYIVFVVLAGEHPRLGIEAYRLLASFGLFLTLALVSSAAFWGVLRKRRWMWAAQAATWLAVVAIARFYWPK